MNVCNNTNRLEIRGIYIFLMSVGFKLDQELLAKTYANTM